MQFAKLISASAGILTCLSASTPGYSDVIYASLAMHIHYLYIYIYIIVKTVGLPGFIFRRVISRTV